MQRVSPSEIHTLQDRTNPGASTGAGFPWAARASHDLFTLTLEHVPMTLKSILTAEGVCVG